MKTGQIDFIASVDDDRVDDIKKIAKKLKDLGYKINNILSFSGIITGSAAIGTQLSDIKINGIKNVELDRSVKTI